MPNINLSILNQKATPSFYADTLANRPAPSFVGRVFISTDTYDLYRDTGSAWDLLSPSAAAGVTGTGVANQVAFWSGTTAITGENNLWWDSTNNHFGINTNTPGTALDIHHDQSTMLQLNQTTATNDSRIAFQNSGTALWRIGNFYNAGANDWGIFDVVGGAQQFTIKKTTGQTFIGAETTTSGKFVVNSATGDNHIVVIGATAPSIRINNAGTGATRQIGIGLATAVNNFIQGTTGGELCLFNSSTTASPILFGVYDAGLTNTQEAARISPARNFLVGTTTDAGQKLQVNGSALATNFVKSGGTMAEILAADGSVITAGSGITISAGQISSSGGGGGGNIALPNFATAQIINASPTPTIYDLTLLFPSINFSSASIHLDMQILIKGSFSVASIYYNVLRDPFVNYFDSSLYTQYFTGPPLSLGFNFGGTNSNPTLEFFTTPGDQISVAFTITTL